MGAGHEAIMRPTEIAQVPAASLTARLARQAAIQSIPNPSEAPSPRSGSRASRQWKFLPAPDAPPQDWYSRIAELKAEKSVVALQALVEAIPVTEARPHLLSAGTAALASLGQDARLAFDDLLGPAQPHDLRLAAINAFAQGFPAERGAVLAAWTRDPDRLIREKAAALQAAFR